jgi:sorbitol-specific phosphotransferase system component IIBC
MDNHEWTIRNGQSGMDNNEWTITNGQTRVATKNTGQKKRKKKHTQRTKKMSTKDATKNWVVNPGAREGEAVPVCYKTSVVFLKYTVKYNVSFQDAVDDLFYD